MKNRKININRPKITKEEIKQHQNFDGVMNSFQKMTRPFYKRPRFFRGIILVAVVAAVVFYEMNKTTDKKEAAVPFVNPPIENVSVEYEKFKVDAAKGAALTYETGSTIHIPENAFVDEKGKPVTGEVEIRYREFHDAADVFLSGIPMSYDSAGTQYHFESAGMLEILAFKNEKPVYLAPQKKIDMEMASFRPGTHYNLYELDTLKRNWVYQGKDKVKELEDVLAEVKAHEKCDTVAAKKAIVQLEKEIVEIKKEIAKIEEKSPVEPKKVNPDRYKFNIAVEANEFPELALYEGMFFEIGPENKNFNPKLANVTWEDALLKEGNKGANYKLTLSKGEESHTFIVYPVFEGKNYDQAMKNYAKKFEEYEGALTTRKADEKKKQEEYLALQERVKQERVAQQKQWEEDYKKQQEEWAKNAAEMKKQWEEERKRQEEAMTVQNKVYRAFQISGMGTYNCDSPHMWPKGILAHATFEDESGKEIALYSVILTELDRNLYFTYNQFNFILFKYNPNSTNMLLGVNSSGKIVVVKPEEFVKIKPENGKIKFKMKTLDQEFKSVDEVRAAFGLTKRIYN